MYHHITVWYIKSNQFYIRSENLYINFSNNIYKITHKICKYYSYISEKPIPYWFSEQSYLISHYLFFHNFELDIRYFCILRFMVIWHDDLNKPYLHYSIVDISLNYNETYSHTLRKLCYFSYTLYLPTSLYLTVIIYDSIVLLNICIVKSVVS